MKIVLASGNAGKLAEFKLIFAPMDISVVPQSEFKVSEVEETGLSFIENAILKARHASAASGLPALADDSGLSVDFLDGAPGIYSARYAGSGASDEDNIDKLLDALREAPEEARGAAFVCALAFVRHPEDPIPVIAQGKWRGAVLTEKHGHEGFGYDPVFWVPEKQCAAAQLSKQEKNAMSHRALAVAQLIEAFRTLSLVK